jgi:phosphatidylglycerophosphate synthase
MSETYLQRRPLSSRNTSWARGVATWLARRRLSPNAISIASAFFALLGGGALIAWSRSDGWGACLCLVGAAAAIQLRLLCNLFDGMVAVEGGLRSATGELFNEVPDRISDTILLVAAGYAVGDLPHGIALGWFAAVGAMLTAYVRMLGIAQGGPALFIGPMAKQHRMAVLTCAALATAVAGWWSPTGWLVWSALAIIAVGSLMTAVRRLARIAAWMRMQPPCSPNSSV